MFVRRFNLSTLLPQLRQQILADRAILWFNGLTLILFLALLTYAKVWGSPQVVEFLFYKEPPSSRPYIGFLTVVANTLWGLSAAVCAFSSGLLRHLHPRRRMDWFLLGPAIGIAVILIDQLYRITISLVMNAGVPKVLLAMIYGIATLVYMFAFWRRLRATPYLLLFAAVGLLIVSRVVDLLKISVPGAPTRMLLEDGTKLLGLLNLALYWWLVSQQEVLRSLKSYSQRLTATVR